MSLSRNANIGSASVKGVLSSRRGHPNHVIPMKERLSGGRGKPYHANGGIWAPVAEDVAVRQRSVSPTASTPSDTQGMLTEGGVVGSHFDSTNPLEPSTTPTEFVSESETTRDFLDASPAGPTERVCQPYGRHCSSVEYLFLALTTAFGVSSDIVIDGEGAEVAASLKALADAINAKDSAELSDLRSELEAVTNSLETHRRKLSAAEKALTKARAQAAILAEELRIRGGTKHYSNLTVKLGIAEAEIRSVNARKMQLAVKLGQVEREKQQALQGQALAEAALHERSNTTLTATKAKRGTTGWRQTSQASSVRQAREETRMALGGLGSAAASGTKVTETSSGYFAECFSSNDAQTSAGKSPHNLASASSADVKAAEGNEVKKSTRSRSGVRDSRRIEASVGGSEGVGVSRRWKQTGAELAAVEKSRASERRCVALLAASSKDLEAERRESERLRDALLLFERKQDAAAGVAEEEHDFDGKRTPKAGSVDGRLHFLFERRRGFSFSSMLSEMAEAMCQLVLGEPDCDADSVNHNPKRFSIRVALASRWAFVLAVAVIVVTLIPVVERRGNTSWSAFLCG